MFEDLEVPEQAYSHQSRLAILRYDNRKYGAKIIDGFFEFEKPFLVKDMKLSIPRSYVRMMGEDYFAKFMAMAFKLMSKPNCPHPLAVLSPLRKKLRRIKLRLLRINSKNPNAALSWYLTNLQEMIKDMWLAAKNNYARWLCDQRIIRKDNEILDAHFIS